jgi:hypothetical protein
MAGAEPYGHIAVNNRIMTDAEVSRVIGMDENTYKGILYRLLEKGIPSKAENGMIYSRRMVREHKKFITGRVSGLKGGGNPALKKEEAIIQKPEPEAKGGLKVPYIGQALPVLDLSSIKGMVQAVKSARPEFKALREMTIEKMIVDCPEQFRVKAVSEFIDDMANALTPPECPTAKLRSYIRTAVNPSKGKFATQTDDEIKRRDDAIDAARRKELEACYK